jgi:hypothetical protein
MEETKLHINCKELLAAWFGLRALCDDEKDCYIRIMSDNHTTVSFIREMGGSNSLEANKITRNIWLWAIERRIWLSCEHIPGVENVEADRKSRKFDLESEWMLNPLAFTALMEHFPDLKNSVNLFATRLNKQCEVYFSWKPDPGARTNDAFQQDWSGIDFVYLFPLLVC